jgi:hypothetical protein
MKRTPIKRVSKKRAQANREYSNKRKDYLIAHPWCQIFMKRYGIDEAVVKANNGVYPEVTYGGMVHWKRVPFANQIHHTKKPKQTYLNVVETWLSACQEQHEWVENNKSKARELGLLENI